MTISVVVFTALPAPIIENHTQSEMWVWLEWEVPFHLYPLPYLVDNFTLCYTTFSTSNSSLNATSSLPNATSSIIDLRPHCEDTLVIGGQRSSANITGLESGRSYTVWLMYYSRDGVGSYWNGALSVETYPGEITVHIFLGQY